MSKKKIVFTNVFIKNFRKMYSFNRNIAGLGALGVVWTLQKFLANYDVASEVFYMPDLSYVWELEKNAYLVKTIPDSKWWYIVPEKPLEIGEVQTQSFIGYLEQGWKQQDAYMAANNFNYEDMAGFITPFPKHIPGMPKLTPTVPTSGTNTEIPFTEIPEEKVFTELPEYKPNADCLEGWELKRLHGEWKQVGTEFYKAPSGNSSYLWQTADGLYWLYDRKVVDGKMYGYYCPFDVQTPSPDLTTDDGCGCDCEKIIETEKWMLTPNCTGPNCFPVKIKVRRTVCEGSYEGKADFDCDEIENIVSQMNR